MPSNGISSIPIDVLVSMIFIRLPARSLPALRLVCKSWYSLTMSPHFIHSHARRSAHIDIVFESKEKKTTLYRHVSLNERAATARTIDFPSKLLEYVGGISKLSLSASCDGLLCLDHWGQYNNGSRRRRRMGYVVCNPVTKDWINVPAGNITSYGGKINFIAGFYFHSSTGEYRLLQQYSKISTGDGYRIEISTVYGYEVFSVRGGAASAWRPIHAPFSPSSSSVDRSFSSSSLDRSHLSSSTVLHGSIHFLLASPSDGDPPCDFIVIFDTNTEKFRKMFLPPRLHLQGYDNSLIVMGGGTTLGFSQTKSFPPRANETDIWCLKDYTKEEWVKQYTFSLWDIYNSLNIFYITPFKLIWEGGKEVLLKFGRNGCCFVLYDLESKTFNKELEIRDLWNWVPYINIESIISCNSSLNWVPYIESLVSFK